MNIPALRALLRPFVGNLKDQCTNTLIPQHCIDLGLPVPDDIGSKRDRWYGAFDKLNDEDVPQFAQSLVDARILGSQLRNEVQDILWFHSPPVEVPKRQRREIARALQPLELFHQWERFRQLLTDVFVILEVPAWLLTPSLHRGKLEEIHQHFVRNPEDSDVEWLFEYLEVFDLSSKRFCMFLEGLVSADIQVDMENQVSMVSAINVPLATCGAEMRAVGEAEGYPTYSLVALRTARGKAKNLIFASARKPDIRFRDAVNNDIEIVSNAEDCLVYDRPLSVEGLRWRDLQQWWSETTNEHDPLRAKTALYRRLLECLPEASPPQRLLFVSFYSSFGSLTAGLPALLPEVWLHWDPLTVAQRGVRALLNHRMDFLLLLPGGSRVIIEVDGMQHYADNAGLADTRRYARLAAGDRSLKLAGYEVYRFAGVELQGADAGLLVKDFFMQLFGRHGIHVSQIANPDTR